MSCHEPARCSSSSSRRSLGLLASVLALGVGLEGCKDKDPPSAESTSSSSTTGEPPPIPCDEEMPCPEEGQSCLVGLCYDGPAPSVTITNPVDQQQLPWDEASQTQPVSVTVQGSGLTLVAASDDPDSARGMGQVVLTLDNFEVAVIESGDLEAGIPIEVDTSALAGAHRLRAFARLSDGTPYDNPEASYNSLFWFNDGLPHVAFNSPLPGEKFLPGAQDIEVTIGVINFSLAPAGAEVQPGRIGHAHIFVDDTFPACAADEECSQGYVAVLAPPGEDYEVTGPVMIPTANGAKTKITALLVRTDHSPFCVDDAEPCVPVFETITIGRMEPMEETTSTGGDTSGTGTGTGGTGGSGSTGG